MRVISQKPLREFWECHPEAERELRAWYKAAVAAEWRTLHDRRQQFPDADAVTMPGKPTLTVFDICHNDYRLIARIVYRYQLINVRCVLTHREYDRGNWKE